MNEMEIEKTFIDRIKIAFDNSDGDLYKFWANLTGDNNKINRTTIEKAVFLFANRRKNKKTGEEFIKHVIKIDDIAYTTNFRTVTVPKFSGSIKLQDYILDTESKTVTVFKYDFMTAKNANNELPF